MRAPERRDRIVQLAQEVGERLPGEPDAAGLARITDHCHDSFDHRDAEAARRRLIGRLERRGFDVSLTRRVARPMHGLNPTLRRASW